jgi:myosin protein heavy chain
MSSRATGGARWRNNPFDRGSPSPSPGPIAPSTRPKSSIFTPPSGSANPAAHSHNQSFSPLSGSTLAPLQHTRERSNSTRTSNQSSNTFAPQFIQLEELQRAGDKVGSIEGENDFSGKRYVWLRDPTSAFMKGWVVEELGGGRLLVQCDDGSV